MTSTPAPPAWTSPPGPVPFAYANEAGLRRRRRLRATLLAVPALLVVVGAATFITILVTGGGHTTSGSGSAAAAPLTSARHATIGTLTAQDGSTWTVRTAQGTTVSVDVGSGTSFGTRAHPSKADAFHDGTKVRVVGAKKGATVDARRVIVLGGTSTSSGSST